MILRIIEYYKTEVDTAWMTHDKVNWMINLWLTSFLVAVISVLANYFVFKSKYEALVILLFVLSALIFFITCIVIKRTKEKLNLLKLNIDKDDKKIDKYMQEERMHNKMKIFLKRNNLYSKEKLILIIQQVDAEITRKKLPNLIAPSILITILLPIWSQVVSKVIGLENNPEKVLYLAGLLLLVVLFFVIYIGGMRIMMQGTFKDIFNHYVQELEDFKRFINDMLLRLEDSKN